MAAPPGALGAHAAGREAAPSLNSLVEPPSLEATPGTPQGQAEPPPEPEPAPDASAPAAPPPSEGVAL